MAGGGGAWKVAYADFVTAMMAFFMVMWLTAQKPEVKESIASYFRDPFADQSGGAESDGPKRPRTPVNSDLPPSNARDQRPVTGRDTPSRQTPPPAIARRSSETPWMSIYFPLDTAVMGEEAREMLAGAAETLLGKPNRVELRAHTVRKPLPPGSPFESHWQLCYKRSELVMAELTKRGVEEYRFRLSQSEANEPATAAVNERSVGENSRVDLYILNEFADPPAGVAGDRWDAENGVVLPGNQLDRKKSGDHGGEKAKSH